MGPPPRGAPPHHPPQGDHPLCSWGAPSGGAPRGPGWVFLYSYPKQGPGDLVGAGRWWANLPMKALLICNFLTKTPLFALYSATANGEKSIKEIIVVVSFIWQVCFLLAFFHREYNLCFLTFFAVHFTVNLIM